MKNVEELASGERKTIETIPSILFSDLLVAKTRYIAP